jgi:hypothetical protein
MTGLADALAVVDLVDAAKGYRSDVVDLVAVDEAARQAELALPFVSL